MKITVNNEWCQGHAQCNARAAELFPLDDEGYTALTGQLDVPPGMEEAGRRGVEACPERVFTILE